jgi:OOP family OmpA-OmpF porin
VPGVAPTGCPDGDQDGVLDRDDKCLDVPGVAPDGCPPDSDGDGFIDSKDKCPNEPETKNGFEDDDGCPDEIPAAVKRFNGVIKGIEFDNGKATSAASRAPPSMNPPAS